MAEKEKIKIEETLEVASEIKALVGEIGKRYRSVEVVGVIVQIEDEGVLFERSYYTGEKYKDITLVSKEEK